jgi:hypothetical protein
LTRSLAILYDKLEMKKPAIKSLRNFKQLDALKANKSLWLIVIVVVLIVAAIPAYYYYSQYKQAQMLLQNPNASASAQAKDLVAKVGTLIVLPTGETPTVATVSDVTKLVGQAFFVNAKNGDKVLVYNAAKELILYRPGLNKIINVASLNVVNVNVPTTTPQAQSTPTPTPAIVTVAIYNGTTTAGLAAKADTTIMQTMSNASITEKGDAKGNYSKTEVIDLSGNNADAANQIANLLNGSVATAAPSGEVNSGSDILVILGSDFSK